MQLRPLRCALLLGLAAWSARAGPGLPLPFPGCGCDPRFPFPPKAALARSPGPADAPATAAATDPDPGHYLGTKRILVLRADFSDRSGESVSAAAAQAMMDQEVKPFFERASYGQTTFVTTVSSRVYRLPRTAQAYATGTGENDVRGTLFPELHADALAAAQADYVAANFDRIVVATPSIGPEAIAGSKFNWGGVADISGRRVQINGAFSFAIVAHELGHTYGGVHSSLWRVAGNDPVAAAGTLDIYGDRYDLMGGGSTAEHDFGPFQKWLMGWLPETALRTVTSTGTYRVHRFDDAGALRAGTLALRVPRDGFRSYWISYRAGIPGNSNLDAGAYVHWCVNDTNNPALLDLAAPHTDGTAVALEPGTVLDDPTGGVRLRIVGRGGTAPQQYLDVEVTLTRPLRTELAGWGGLQSYGLLGVAAAVPDVVAVAAGDFHSLALRRDGTLWTGSWTFIRGEDRIPAGLNDVVAIAAGQYLSGAVRRDGSVVIWGDTAFGLASPPAGLGGVRALDFGSRHALALREDGTVVAWGTGSNLGEQNVPAGLSGVVAISAGGNRSLALRRDGTVVAWGNGAAQVPAGLSSVVAVSCHNNVGFAVRADGTVAAWGSNISGQLDVPAGLSGVKAIFAGSSAAAAVRADGSVVSWGNRTTLLNSVPPYRDLRLLAPAGLPPARAVSLGIFHTLAVVGGVAAPVAAAGTQDSGRFTAAWSAVAGSVRYRVDVSAEPTFASFISGYAGRDAGTATTLEIAGLAPASAYYFRVRSEDASGDTAVSNVAVIAATPPPPPPPPVAPPPAPGRLVNLSVRSFAGTGDRTLIAGFVLGGAGSKNVIVRGIGPQLAAFGVGGALADPRLELFAGSALLGSNDNWTGEDGRGLGAFALPAGSRDSVLRAGLGAGAYTAQVKSAITATGNALIEIYDAAPTAANPTLANLSARTQLDAGQTLIGGFAIGGATARTVLVRAVGPGLAALLDGAHPDPKLTLFRGTERLQENDNWTENDGRALGAFPLTAGSRDAVLRATLSPGAYSVHVEGIGSASGIVLLEVYDAP